MEVDHTYKITRCVRGVMVGYDQGVRVAGAGAEGQREAADRRAERGEILGK